MENIYSNLTTSITELKKSPTALLNASEGRPIALLNNNKPTAYIVPAKLYEKMLDYIDDINLARIANSRLNDKSEYVKVDLDEI